MLSLWMKRYSSICLTEVLRVVRSGNDRPKTD